jgi:hypothetical protein
MRVKPFSVRVALAGDGTPQIKALLDGTRCFTKSRFIRRRSRLALRQGLQEACAAWLCNGPKKTRFQAKFPLIGKGQVI